MNTQLENQLYQIDPIFFEHAIKCNEGTESAKDTCMYFGCECGDGWFNPIKTLVQKTAILNTLAKQYNTKFVCDQLKSKYGTFTCYYGSYVIDVNKKITNQEYIDTLYDMLTEAVSKCEDDCWNVCEWCGAAGGYDGENLITTTGWISRICKKCAKQHAEYETKHYDEIHKQDYKPRITWFHDGYEFLNLFHIHGFEYPVINSDKTSHASSIIEAFYCSKDPEHKDIYQEVGRNHKDYHSPYLVKNIANQFGYFYNDTEEDYQLLKSLVKAKFTYQYNKSLKTELLETIGKNLQNMGRHCDNVLGYCVCDKCTNKEHKDLYAKILMEVREEIQLEENSNNVNSH